MKITIKTLKGQQLPLEIEPEMIVTDLKAKIAEVHGIAAETQKLIAYGKVMDDGARTVASYNIVEGGFIVVMAVKAKPVKPATEEVKQESVGGVTLPAQADQPAQAQATAQTQPTSQSQPPTQQQPEPTVTATSSNANPTALPAGVDEESVSTLVGITGRDRNICVQALQVTQGNLDLACSLIFEGVSPEQLQQMAASAGAGGMPGGGVDDYGDEQYNEGSADIGMGAGLPGAGASNDFSELMANPAWPTIVERLRTNPQFYQEFMQLLSTQNPTVFNRIQQNPMGFMNLVLSGNPNIGGAMGAGGAGAGGAGAGQQPRRPPPGSIQVTSAEMEAIQRLQSLGFSQHQALEAYMVCDKNEEFAANYLFEQAMGDESAAMNNAVAESMAAATGNEGASSEAQPQPQPEAQQQQPAAEGEAQQQPAADQQQQQQPGADAEMNNADNADANNNNNNNDGGDAGAGGAGDGGEKSAFE